MSTLKEAILNAEDIKHKDVEIPEWGGVTVRVKALNTSQFADYQAKSMAMRQEKGSGGVDFQVRNRNAQLVVQCLYDPESGERIFKDNEAKVLLNKNAGTVNALFALIQDLSGLNRSFEERVKDAEGNSEGAQS